MAVAPTREEEKNLDPLERAQSSIKKNLEATTQKLVTARLGESLELGQQSERLEVIEQPTLPIKPIKPNRPKFLALVLAMSAAAGGGLVFLLEFLQSTIYRTSDLLRIADSHLVVVLPYVTTEGETQRRKTRTVLLIGSAIFVVIVAALASLFFLPPLDILFDKILLALGM
jgi:capsular polysaccharide biosynthesis protein